MRVFLAVLVLVLLSGCIHGGRDITGGGVTAYTGKTGISDDGNTGYQHQFCEGGTQYEGDKPGLFVCAGGTIVYKYANVTSPSLLRNVLSLGNAAAIAYAGDKIGEGIGKSGSKTNVNQEGGGASAKSDAFGQGNSSAAASGGAGGNGYGYGGKGGSSSSMSSSGMPMRGRD